MPIYINISKKKKHKPITGKKKTLDIVATVPVE